MLYLNQATFFSCEILTDAKQATNWNGANNDSSEYPGQYKKIPIDQLMYLNTINTPDYMYRNLQIIGQHFSPQIAGLVL